MKSIRTLILILLTLIVVNFNINNAWAFCGFYVAKADTKLYNQASQVIIAKDGNRTVLTLANDYQGEVKDFALVVPVPVVLKEEQVHIGDPKILERLDGFSAPRLVEYFDPDPCAVYPSRDESRNVPAAPMSASEMKTRRNNVLGVTVEEQFTVGEYDILILSAKESNGLEIWLTKNGYKMPKGASQALQTYIKQEMKFFVAKVNLTEYSKTGFNSLRPLMIAYEYPKFMLPIRLGMLNGKGDQDLIVYLLSPKGQTELTNYRTIKVPSDVEIPEFVKAKFGDFYQAMFKNTYEENNKKVAFLEYAWDMASCDPCSADPLNPEELKKAGVFWVNETTFKPVFISRIHIRYSRATFPEDLQFQETANNQLFQGRYIMRHPFKESRNCEAMTTYKKSVKERQENEAKTLAKLTGWELNKIREKIEFIQVQPEPWWRKLW